MSIATMAVTYLSVKIRDDVYRMIKTLAAWDGKTVSEYLSDLVEPIAREEMQRLSREAAKSKKDKP